MVFGRATQRFITVDFVVGGSARDFRLAAGKRRVRPATMPRTALFPGSFDPVTNGHLDVVRQAARLADRLLLAIGTHPGKTPLFTVEERLAMLEETCAPVARAAGCELPASPSPISSSRRPSARARPC